MFNFFFTFPNSYVLLRAAVPWGPCFIALTVPNSDIQFGDRNLSLLLGALITYYLPRKQYSVQIIIMQQKHVFT